MGAIHDKTGLYYEFSSSPIFTERVDILLGLVKIHLLKLSQEKRDDLERVDLDPVEGNLIDVILIYTRSSDWFQVNLEASDGPKLIMISGQR